MGLILAKDYVSPVIGLLLVCFSIYIFLQAIQLMISRDIPSSLLSTLIGFVALTGGLTLIRTWILARVVDKSRESQTNEKGKESKSKQ